MCEHNNSLQEADEVQDKVATGVSSTSRWEPNLQVDVGLFNKVQDAAGSAKDNAAGTVDVNKRNVTSAQESAIGKVPALFNKCILFLCFCQNGDIFGHPLISVSFSDCSCRADSDLCAFVGRGYPIPCAFVDLH